jgi:DNA-binding MarR family transcriptional regulator
MSKAQAFIQLGRENLSKEAYRVLMVVLGSLDIDAKTRIPQREVAELLDMPKQAVSRAFQLLSDRKILIPDPAPRRPKTYYLNTNFGSVTVA